MVALYNSEASHYVGAQHYGWQKPETNNFAFEIKVNLGLNCTCSDRQAKMGFNGPQNYLAITMSLSLKTPKECQKPPNFHFASFFTKITSPIDQKFAANFPIFPLKNSSKPA